MQPLIKYSKRRTLALKVDTTGNVIVLAPRHICVADIDRMLLKHQDWISMQKAKVSESHNKLYDLNYNPEQVRQYKKAALQKFARIAEIYAKRIGVEYSELGLSNAKSRWGSCTSNKTVRINWRLIFAPEILQVYVVIHELAHLKHMDHSKRFWDVVENELNDYKKLRKMLKEYEFLFLL